jgi:hypothetical protein
LIESSLCSVVRGSTLARLVFVTAVLVLANAPVVSAAEDHEREPGPERLEEILRESAPTARHVARDFTAVAPAAASFLDGDAIIRSFTAHVAPCGVGTGIAFDGTNLLISCWYTNTIEVVSAVDGALLSTHTITGLSGIGAIAWDVAGSQLWACNSVDQSVVTIDLETNVAQPRFASRGCLDGLSFDGFDNTVWASADAAPTLEHYRPDGSLIDSFQLNDTLGGCGNSGIAAGTNMLFMANNGCSQIYQVPKDHVGATGADSETALIGGYPARLEDLECDDQTFDGTTVIWSKDAYDAVINAFDVGSVDCGVGGYRDTDADGLSDELEESPAYQAMGASPDHKDLFAELDYYAEHGHNVGPWSVGGWSRKPSPDVINKIINAFNIMGVANRDGANGVRLHLDGGPETIMDPATGEKWGARSRSNAIYGAPPASSWEASTWWTHVDDLRSANVDPDRRASFHYIVLVDHMSNDHRWLGQSRGIPGHDVVAAAGDLNDSSEPVTIAHELGHNLGLGHGGADNPQHPATKYINKKSNYLSIMNYFYSVTGMQVRIGGRPTGSSIVFSPQQHDPLDMENLDETGGLSPDPFAHWVVKYRCLGQERTADGWNAIDWNCQDGILNGSSNFFLQERPPQDAIDADPDVGRKVFGSNDYAGLRFWGVGEAWDAANRAMVELEQPGTEEPTIEELQSDGDFYAYPTLITDTPQDVELTAAAGPVEIPVTVRNPTAYDTDAITTVTADGPGVSLKEAAPLSLAGGAVGTRTLLVDTGTLTPGTVRLVHVVFVVDHAPVADAQFTLHVQAAGSSITCAEAADVIADPAATTAQVAAAQAVQNACSGGASGSGSGATGESAPPAVLDRAAIRARLRALLRRPTHPTSRQLLQRSGFRASFTAPAPGVLSLRWRSVTSVRRTLASGRVRFLASGRKVIRVRLTPAGRHLIRARTRVRVHADAAFRPTGQPTISIARTVRIAHGH